MLRLLLLTIAFSSSAVQAEWKLYGQKDGGQGFYDASTVRVISKNKVEVLTYVNLPKEYVEYRTRLGKPLELSSKVTQQYDCKKKTYQFLEITTYSGNHLHGKSIRHAKYAHAEVNYIDRETPAANLYKILCAK